jgi:exodeoxyribonuclease VII large subunit
VRLFDPETTLTVRDLADALAGAVAAAFPDEVWVRGELSGLKRSAAGHVYFDLVDPGGLGDPARAHLPVALFSGNKRTVNRQLTQAGMGQRLTDGLEVRIRGRVELHAARGRVQLVMSAIDPDYTLGRLAADREHLLKALAAEGLLGRNPSRPLALAPRHIGLVTSAGSAACTDFLHELEASGVAWRVRLIDTRVQGDEAQVQIVAGLRTAVRAGVEAIALVRGGGARTDLIAFDGEQVARAVALCPVPVFTGIGHEVDRSVADEVAHTATKTPTACAAELVARVRVFLDRTDVLARELDRCAERTLDRQRHRLDAAAVATARHGARNLDRCTTDLARAQADLLQGAPRVLAAATRRLDSAAVQTRALDPARALARGWSITRDGSGRVVRSAHQVPAGGPLVTQLADGFVHSTADGASTGGASSTADDTGDSSD